MDDFRRVVPVCSGKPGFCSEDEDMKITKFSQVLAIVSWGSLFVEGWLLILRAIPSDPLSWGFYVLFFVIAIFASAFASSKKAE